MSSITTLIKDLRVKTGAGFLDCKNALSENDNDIEKAIEYLRKKGLAKASKKTSREAVEGAVGIYSSENLITILKINSETDFAAKSEAFLSFLDEIGNFVLENNNPNLNIEELLSLQFKNTNISDYLNSMIAKIGENLVLSELKIFEKKELKFNYYVHNSYKDNIGKMISLISYESKTIDKDVKEFSKNLCMHIAAMKPESLDINDLDKSLIEKEKEVQKELILNSGKPSNIVDKILEGKMNKFYSEVTLKNQSFILDQDKKIKDVIDEFNTKSQFNLISYELITL